MNYESRITKRFSNFGKNGCYLFFASLVFLNLSACSVVGNVCLDVVVVVQKSDFTSLLT